MNSSDRWDQTDFFPEAEAARRRRPRLAAAGLLLLLLLLLATFAGWAGLTEIDEMTRAEGKVVSSSKTQIVQNLEGGMLGELLVQEGQTVDQNQPLLRIDSTIATAQLQKSRAEYLSLTGKLARLDGEIENRLPRFPADLLQEAPEVAQNEKALFQVRKQALTNELAILERQVGQRRQELVELQSKVTGLEKTAALLMEELTLTRPLLADGAVSKIDLLRLERQFAQQESELKVIKLAIPRVKSALKEAVGRVEGARLTFHSESLDLKNAVVARLSAIREVATAEQDRVRRTEVIAPVRGIVKVIHFTTPGAVIRAGEAIVEIVPIDDLLRIEAWVSPRDVAFLRPGLAAAVNITAYDAAIYGTLDAQLQEISADTFADEKGYSFFRIYLTTQNSGFGNPQNPLPIIPGMTASVDIITGKKTILDYLLKPIRRAQKRALRER
ncbi:MAG: HlyD family type I secretion periplasmic adaptor subunit [Magnetococcales bacterium]|nr:HlyD family type I secretion periplasmic adaptor subunit [Magnetococcales bacterium]